MQNSVVIEMKYIYILYQQSADRWKTLCQQSSYFSIMNIQSALKVRRLQDE